MKITQIDDVELISIKTKSLEDLDNEINFNLNANAHGNGNGNGSAVKANEYVGAAKSFKAKTPAYKIDSVVGEQEMEDENDSDHYESSVRCLTIDKSPNGACGFHLTRTKWDPYPWVGSS